MNCKTVKYDVELVPSNEGNAIGSTSIIWVEREPSENEVLAEAGAWAVNWLSKKFKESSWDIGFESCLAANADADEWKFIDPLGDIVICPAHHHNHTLEEMYIKVFGYKIKIEHIETSKE